MAISDQIANAIIKIQNAVRAKHPEVSLPRIKILGEILRVLKKEGFIEEYTDEKGESVATAQYKVTLRYNSTGGPVIHGVRRISKPSRRVYTGYSAMPSVYNNFGRIVVSTSQGIITDAEAKRRKVGGELLFSVW